MNPLLPKNQTIQQMVLNNPNYKQVMDYVKTHGGNPKEAFYQLAKEKGVDPQMILNQIK